MKVYGDTFDEPEQRVYRLRVSTEEREAKTKGEERERGGVLRYRTEAGPETRDYRL